LFALSIHSQESFDLHESPSSLEITEVVTKYVDISKKRNISTMAESSKLKVVILGYGALGKHLYQSILKDKKTSRVMEVCGVWNRSAEVFEEPGTCYHISIDCKLVFL